MAEILQKLIPWRRKREIPVRREETEEALGAWSLNLYRDLQNLFDSLWEAPFSLGSAFRPLREFSFPKVDLEERDDAYLLRAEIPGVTEKEIDVSVSHDAVVIRGEKESRKETNRAGFHYSESYSGRFERRIPLPREVDADKATAEYSRGVLTVTLPKTERSKARRIPLLQS